MTNQMGKIAYIGLGSNLEQPSEQLKAARTAIGELDHINETIFSSIYRSPPMGPQDQPDYLNAVMAIETSLPPLDLLHKLQSIENSQGRIRLSQRWTARTLDLDILLYGNEQLNLPQLKIPHPGIAERAFVLYPLFEIAPELNIPGLGSLAQIIRQCPSNGLERLAA